MGVALTIGALLLICVMTSTKQGRAEAQARLKPYEKWLWLAAAVLWGLLILGWIFPSAN